MERVFKLAGKTHYSNASFLVGTGLSALAFTSKLPVNIWKHMFLKGSNDRSTVGEYFGTGFYQYYSRHGAQVKKNVQNESCKFLNADFSPQFLMRPAGFTWFKIMRPLSESCVWDAGRAGKKITGHAGCLWYPSYMQLTLEHLIIFLNWSLKLGFPTILLNL